jgi:hypothetical protein
VAGSVVDWNGVALTTTYVSATDITAAVPAGDIATAGTASVTVVNAAPGGGTTSPITFTTNNPAPTLASLSQTSAIAGSAGFTLTLTGTNFVAGSIVDWNGVALATNYVSATDVTATVPVGDLATAGTASVTVVNAAPAGGTSSPITFTINNPAPTLTSLSQTTAIAGSAGFTLTLTGTNFVAGSVVDWNGVALTTTHVSATDITAAVPAGDIANPGTASVTVVNAPPGGGTSGAITFSINNPVPTLASLSQTSAVGGTAAFALTVTGTNFIAASVVDWNGAALATTFNSATSLTATVPAADIANSGTVPITVFNPLPGGGTSAAITFTINSPVPTVTLLSQTSAIAGSPAFTLTVTGTNFETGTVIDWNGAALATTVVSTTQVTATVPVGDIALAGTASVTAFNPLPGGGASNATTFTINNPAPTLASLSQTSAIAGSAGFTLTLTGTNFVAGSVVDWNGVALATNYVSATDVTATVPAGDVALAGTIPVTVVNAAPGGGASNAITFTINNPAPTLGSLSQTSAIAGTAGFTLTLTGTNFEAGTVVDWNGVPLTTIYVSPTDVTATVPAGDIALAGTASVTVVNALPGGGTSAAITFTINNPLPTLTSLSQTSAIGGTGAFTLTLTGTNFVASSGVDWNGTEIATTFNSATSLTATVPAADIANSGTASVTVANPLPGGGVSAAITFTINSPVPTVGTLSQTSAIAGSAAFTLTVTGTNFETGTVVEWNGVALATTVVSPTQVTAVVPVGDIAAAGTASVTVFNPLPGGGPSTPAVTFTIDNPVPTLTSLSQNTATTGSPAFTLTVMGTNLDSLSVVQWNGVALATAFVSSTDVTATVPLADLATAGTDSVTLFNATPGGGASSAATFTVDNAVPVLTGLSQTSAIAGTAGFTLTVTGSGFVAGTVVDWNGVPLVTTVVSLTQITAAVPAADIATGGSDSVTVVSPAPGGGSSAASIFTVNNPVPVVTALSTTIASGGGAGFTLTVTGTNFVVGAVVEWNGVPLVTTLVSSTQLTAVVPAADIAASGIEAVTVVNGAPAGGASNAISFTVTNFSVTSPTPAQTVTAGGSAMFTISTAPVGGAYTNPVVLTVTGLPVGATATFTLPSVTAGTGTTMTVTTTARPATVASHKPFGLGGPSFPPSLPVWPAFVAMSLAAIALAFRKRMPLRRLVPVAALILLIVATGYIAGCAGGFPGLQPPPGTPAGTYPLVVTGTSGTDVHTTTVTLIVQ